MSLCLGFKNCGRIVRKHSVSHSLAATKLAYSQEVDYPKFKLFWSIHKKKNLTSTSDSKKRLKSIERKTL